MNLYRCCLNTGDPDLDSVTLMIAAETRNQAKYHLIGAAQDAGFEMDWLTRVSIRIERKEVPDTQGIVEHLLN